ncbi:nitrate- and nitrite sensing domain-containing protein [Sphaerisporangium perillae]|uniref:nitrate- and nitrite sensing domain-containing protein n=1 Tax=Sphaerisporangium perillae TaxID=2935860 RepID=UPI00243613E6|nr:nitrate- and nitrite sensing domain-containing protein [Sphaerisporangium perillae]
MALRNWRVRTRLIALILVPTTVAVLLGGLRVATSIQSATEYERVRTVAEFVTTLGDLVHQLDLERDLTSRFVANGRRGTQAKLLIRDQQNAVDVAAQRVLDRKETVQPALGDIGRTEFDRVLDRLSELRTLRQTTGESQLPPLPSLQKYNLVIDDMLALFDETARGSSNEALDASAAAFASLARAAEQSSRQRGLMSMALIARKFDQATLDAFETARSQQTSELNTFLFRATPAERQAYSDTASGQQVDLAAGLVERVLFLTREGAELRDLGGGRSDIEYWFNAANDGLNRMHEAQRTLGRSIVDRAAELARTDQRQAAVNIGVVALLLILVLVITTVMARSLVSPLRQLRREALEIAGRRLPEMVQKLRESEGNTGPPDVRPIGVASTDEVGEVARAFDEVHREAIRLASDEAQLRSNVSAMFVNLSRRTQTLVERQITLIDGLEQGEQDDKRLGDLFRLDHLATRMRRNSENLLVLAGQEPARRWSQPVPLLDVTRASLSEVENYERVAMNVPGGVSIAGQAVNDVIHLLAELVENAISFSPRDTRVTVSGNRIDGGGVMISITDAGIGMTDEELAQTNWRLANPPVVDVSVSRRMGLFVVGRLALRNGIRVQLRRHDTGGLTAMVLLPESLMGTPTHLGGGPASAGQPFAGTQAPAWSATGQPAGQSMFGSAPQTNGAFDVPAGQGAFGGSFADPGGFGANGAGPLGPTTGGGLAGPNSGPGGYGSGGFSGPPTGSGGYYGPGSGGFGGPPTGSGFGGPPTGPGGYGGPATGSGAFGSDAFSTPATGSGGYGGPATGSGGYGGPPTGAGSFGGPATGTGSFGGPATGAGNFGGSATGPNSFAGPPTGPGRGGDGGELPTRMRPRRYDTSDLDAAATGPLPVVHTSPMEQEEEFLPIFASVESAWFRRVDREQDKEKESTGWQEIPADAGWQAAAVVQEPVRDGTTSAGLPKRVPKANLVPGSAGTPEAAATPLPAMPALSPDRARSRLSSFQQGIRQGRAVARGELSEDEVAFNAELRRIQGDKEDK